jgi:hypothetical protein
LISDEDACNLSFQGVQTGAGANADCFSLNFGKLFLPADERFSRKADDELPSNAALKNGWSQTSIIHMTQLYPVCEK